MKTNHSFEDDVLLNKFKIDEECEKQSSLYYYWANKLADAKSELDKAEDQLKLGMAENELSIREKWDDSWGKITEAAVKARLEKEVSTYREEIRNCQKEVYILEAGVKALDHKKSQLDNLTTLLVKGFYATPNGGKNRDINDEVSETVRSKMNKRRKNSEEE